MVYSTSLIIGALLVILPNTPEATKYYYYCLVAVSFYYYYLFAENSFIFVLCLKVEIGEQGIA